MNYLRYIEHSAENLQFYLWYRSYVERFDKLPASEQALSPEWSAAQMDTEITQPARRKKTPAAIATVLRGTDFADTVPLDAEKRDPFNDPRRDSPEMMRTPASPTFSEFESSCMSDERPVSSRSDFQRKAGEAMDDAGMKWKPCTYNLCPSFQCMLIHQHSYRTTFPRRTHPYHHNIHRCRRIAPTQPLRPRTQRSTPRSSTHHSPIRPSCRLHQRRIFSTPPGPPQLHQMDHLQRQSPSCNLRPRPRHLVDPPRHPRRSPHHSKLGKPCLQSHSYHRTYPRHLHPHRSMEGNVCCPPRDAPSPPPPLGALRRP